MISSKRQVAFHTISKGDASEIGSGDALQVTLPNGVSFLIMAEARPDGAVVLHLPADPDSSTSGVFSLEAGAANTLFLRAERKPVGGSSL